MSKWREQYETHPYREIWESLKQAVDLATFDDETVSTLVSELTRLKRVVVYLDDLLVSLEPELVPLNMWGQFQSQAQACLEQVNAYSSLRSEAHLSQANAHADNLLTYLRPYMVLPKEAAASLKRTATIYANMAEKELDDFRGRRETALQMLQKSEQTASELNSSLQVKGVAVAELVEQLFGKDADGGLKTDVEEFVDHVRTLSTEVASLHTRAIVGESGNVSIKDELDEIVKFSRKSKKDLSEVAAKIDREISDIRSFHIRAFGETDDDGNRVDGMDDELQALLVRLLEFEQTQSSKHLALEKRIETLLPGATSAGLASAYKDLKDTFVKPIQSATTVFYTCIALLIAIAFYSTVKEIGGASWITFKDFADWQTVLRGVVFKIPMYGPAVWLAYFATRRRSEAQRLMQEYAHKEAVAGSFMSYKKQLDELQEEGSELLLKLLSTTIDAVARNASVTLDGEHGDKSPTQELMKTLESMVKTPGVLQVFQKSQGSL